jgi:hypothetical protein
MANVDSIHLDRLGEVSIKEQAGEIVEIVRGAIVTIATAGGYVATRILDAENVPQVGDAVISTLPLLKLEDRELDYINDTKDGRAVFKLTLTYRLQRETAAFPLRGGTTLQQVTTQVDRMGAQITVSHQGDTQGGEVSVMDTQGSMEFETVEATNDPSSIAKEWVKHVNISLWNGDEAGRWLITDATWDIKNSSSDPRTYKFKWQMEYNANGHKPSVAYKDPQTNKMPDGLVDGTGIKDVDWYEDAEFNDKFPLDT